jgi:hypothetical protein
LCCGLSPSGKLWEVINPGFWPAGCAYLRLKLTAVRVLEGAAAFGLFGASRGMEQIIGLHRLRMLPHPPELGLRLGAAAQ